MYGRVQLTPKETGHDQKISISSVFSVLTCHQSLIKSTFTNTITLNICYVYSLRLGMKYFQSPPHLQHHQHQEKSHLKTIKVWPDIISRIIILNLLPHNYFKIVQLDYSDQNFKACCREIYLLFIIFFSSLYNLLLRQ